MLQSLNQYNFYKLTWRLTVGAVLGLGLIIKPSLLLAEPKLLFLGDSLTEGLGVSKAESYPYRLAENLTEQGFPDLEITVDGISGSTSISGISRLKRHYNQGFTHLFLALGANDGLRGYPNSHTYQNLVTIIKAALAQNMTIFLAGMQVPTNLGVKYSREFAQIFPRLIKEFKSSGKLVLYPFLLEGVALDPALNQRDALHPNADGHLVMADKLTEFFKKHL